MSLFLALAVLTQSAVASPLEKPVSEKGENYLSFLEFTGEQAECIGGWYGGNKNNVKRTIGLDDFHILFKMHDNNYYINEVRGENGCYGAGKNASISIDIGARDKRHGICEGDRAAARRGSGRTGVWGGACDLGVFYGLTRKADDTQAD